MPLWGTGHKWGEANLKFGSAMQQFIDGHVGALTAPQAATWQTFAGASPAFPTIHPAARFLCADLHVFDTTSWTPGAVLPHIAPGAVRTASLGGVSWEQQALSFTVADLAYYQTGAGAGLLVPDAYVCVVWTVQVPGLAAQTYQSPPFRLVTGPQPVWDASSGTWQGKVDAVDFAQPVFAAKNDAEGALPFNTLYDIADFYIATGGTVSPASGPSASPYTYGTLLYALTWYALYFLYGANFHDFTVAPWGTPSAPPDTRGNPLAVGLALLVWGSAGTYTAFYDRFNALSAAVGGFRQTFDATGRLLLRAWTPRDSGWFISCNATAPGSQPLPWTLPISRTIKAPTYSVVKYARVTSPDPTGGGGGGGTGPDPGTVPVSTGEVRAWALANPYRSDVASVEQIIDRDTSQSVAGYSSPTEMCRERLRNYLGAADTLSIAVDASVPPPQLGTVLRVQMPPDIDGIYIVTGWSQPLSGGMGSLQAQWYEDV